VTKKSYTWDDDGDDESKLMRKIAPYLCRVFVKRKEKKRKRKQIKESQAKSMCMYITKRIFSFHFLQSLLSLHSSTMSGYSY